MRGKAPCRSRARSFDAWVKGRETALEEKGQDDEVHGDREGEQGLRGGEAPGREDPDRDGQVQRRARESRRDAGGRGAPGELEGRAGPLRGSQEADRHRRTVRRDEGA